MEKEEKKAEKKKGQSEGVRRGRTRINKKIVCDGCIRIDANICHTRSQAQNHYMATCSFP